MSRSLLLCRESPNNTTFPRFTLQLLKPQHLKNLKQVILYCITVGWVWAATEIQWHLLRGKNVKNKDILLKRENNQHCMHTGGVMCWCAVWFAVVTLLMLHAYSLLFLHICIPVCSLVYGGFGTQVYNSLSL